MGRRGGVIRLSLVSVTALGAAYYLFMGYINPVLAGWPMTVDAAADEALSWLSAEQKSEFRAMSKEQLYEYHFGVGMAIRNRFGLWNDNWPLLQSACDTRCHPDDASGVILERMWRTLQAPPSPQ